jgi:hypothetical protein
MKKLTFAAIVSSGLAAVAIGLTTPGIAEASTVACRRVGPSPFTRRTRAPAERIPTRPLALIRTCPTASGRPDS